MNTPESHAMGLAIALEAIHPHNADSLLALSVVKSSAAELRRLHAVNADLLVALNRIAKWNEHTVVFALDYGSMGVRDFYRSIALEAIDQATGMPSTQP